MSIAPFSQELDVRGILEQHRSWDEVFLAFMLGLALLS